MNLIWSKLSWKGDITFVGIHSSANQWISQDILSLSSNQSIQFGLVYTKGGKYLHKASSKEWVGGQRV